jgi:flagellar motor switch protein FliG
MSPSLPLTQNLPGARKAAMFLMGIGDQISADLIRQLAPQEIRRISREIATLNSVQPDDMIYIFREFESLTATSRFFARGGAERAKHLLEQAVGPESATMLMKDAPAPPPDRRDEGEPGPLDNTDPKELAKVLREENPQTLALILSNLPPEKAGPLMASLAPEVQPQVALRIALMDRISPDVFRRIAEAIRMRLKAAKQLSRSNGTRALASILNYVDGETTEKVLSTLEPENETAVAAIRDLMFVFEDILTIDKEGIKALLAKVDRKVLTLALKGTSEKLRTHFTQCMSSRSAEMLGEDMDALGPVRIRDVTAAQSQVVTVVRQLQKDGSIAARSGGGGGASGGGDEYVV